MSVYSEGVWTCNQCEQEFSSYKELKIHLNGGHEVNKITVTEKQINDIMLSADIQIQTHGGKTTIVVVTLTNGFKIVESSSCVDPANYDERMGAEICLARIANKVWELEGYRLQQKVYEDSVKDFPELPEDYATLDTNE